MFDGYSSIVSAIFAKGVKSHFLRVATVREKYLENEIFSRSGNSQEILWMAREIRKDLKSQEKVRDFENKWLWQAVFRKFIYSVQEGKGYFLMR